MAPAEPAPEPEDYAWGMERLTDRLMDDRHNYGRDKYGRTFGQGTRHAQPEIFRVKDTVRICRHVLVSSTRKTWSYHLVIEVLRGREWLPIPAPCSTMYYRWCRTDGRYDYGRTKVKLRDKLIEYIYTHDNLK